VSRRAEVDRIAEYTDVWDVCRGLLRVAAPSRLEWAHALSAVLSLLLGRLEGARLLRDDRPELVAAALRRWADGGAPIEDVREARKLLTAARGERNSEWFNRDWKGSASLGVLATARVADTVEAVVDFVLGSYLDDCRDLESALWSASNALATIEGSDSVGRYGDIASVEPEAWAQVRVALLGAMVEPWPTEPDTAVELAAAMRDASAFGRS